MGTLIDGRLESCMQRVFVSLCWETVHACSVTQSCLTRLCDSMDCNLPGSSVHRIIVARILEWVAISFSRGSSHPRDQTHISCIGKPTLPSWPSGKESTCQCRRLKFNLWVRKIPWRRKWQPTQISCLRNPMDSRAWWARVHGVTEESDTT